MSASNNGPSAIENFIFAMPRITKYWFSLSLIITLVGRFNPYFYGYFALTYDGAIKNFQVWRFLTSAITFPLSPYNGYSFLITMYLLYSISSSLQKGDYSEREGDYFYLLLICSSLLWVISIFVVTLEFVFVCLVMAIMYIWAQLNSENEAMYLPYVVLAMEFIIFFSGMETLIGIIVGHIYFFLTYKYPIEFGGREFIVTPKWIKNFFPNTVENRPTQPSFNAFNAANRQPSTAPTNIRGHTWGSGRRLTD